MKVLLVRHAPAGDKAAYAKTGKPDSERPLTAAGRRKMKKGAKGLRSILSKLDLIATSPLERALETARILGKAYGKPRQVELRELEPDGRPESLVKRLQSFKQGQTVALVGHEPHLSSVIAHLLAGARRLRIELKKGAACLLDFPGKPRAGEAMLLWALTPSQLRELAD